MNNTSIALIYRQLLEFYGPQHWWPSESEDETIMGAILTQNVAWSNVEKAIVNLKKAKILTLENILEIKSDVLADLVLPARFSRQKSVYLKETASFFKNYQYDYERLSQLYSLHDLRKKILDIKGVGNETADTILLYALKLPSFVVDAYTKRIFYRLGLLNHEQTSYHQVQEMFHLSLNHEASLFNEYHALIVQLAKDFCLKKNPLCEDCPLNLACLKKIT